MAIIRVVKTSNFTVMANYHLDDSRLSLKAVGLLCYILRQPDDWDYTVEWLASKHKDGRDSIRAALKELEAAGYVVREQSHSSAGTFSQNDYTVYEIPPSAGSPSMADPPSAAKGKESPSTEKPSTVEPSEEKPSMAPLTENPPTVNPTTEKPLTENPPQPNTKQPSTLTPHTPQGAEPAKQAQAESGGKSDVSRPKWKPERFEAFYRAYPRKQQRKAAARAWDKLKPTEPMLRIMAAALAIQLRSPEWQRESGRYIPMPSSWLNGRRWEDKGIDPPPEQQAAATVESFGERWG